MIQELESAALHTLASHLRRCATLCQDRRGVQILFEASHKLDTRAEEIIHDAAMNQGDKTPR